MTGHSQVSLDDKLTSRMLFGAFALYVLSFYTICCLKYYGFVYNDFDFAIHDQIIWNILHGHIFNSILGVDFLGNHVHFISFLVAPFYALVPHPLFLLFLQTVFLAAGVFPLYALARLYLDCEISLIVGIVYLLFPGLGFTNLYEFHPTCFATFFLLCSAYYFYKENFLKFNVFMVMSLICQENIPLIFFMWGIYSLFLRRPWVWVWWPSLLGALYFICCVYFILPHFNKGVFNFFNIYGPLGSCLGDVAKNCLIRPGFVLSIIFQPHKIFYLFELFWSVGFLPLLSPLSLLPAFLVFLQHLLSFRQSEVSLHFHYTAELIPFIFVGLIFGLKKILIFESKGKILRYILLFNAVIVSLIIGPRLNFLPLWDHLNSDSTIQKEALVEKIPPNASVVATFEFLPHLSHRENLYSFHHVYSGFFTLFTKRYELPDNAQYALIDFNDLRTFRGFYNSDNYLNIMAFLKSNQWGVVDVQNDIVMLKKGVKDKYPLLRLIDSNYKPQHVLNTIIDQRILLEGYDINKSSGRLDLIFYWKLLQPEARDVNLFVDLMDRKGSLLERQLRPIGFRIWPTQAWKLGQVLEDHQYFTITPRLADNLNSLKVGFIDYISREMLRVDGKDRSNVLDIKVAN